MFVSELQGIFEIKSDSMNILLIRDPCTYAITKYTWKGLFTCREEGPTTRKILEGGST